MAMQLAGIFSQMQAENADYQNAMAIRAGYASPFSGPMGMGANLSTSFSMQQMRNNMFGAQFPGQNIYWGGNQLLGPMMMGGGAPMMMNMMSPMYMNLMMQQYLQQQAPPSYYAPQGYRQPTWQTNPSTGLPRLSNRSSQPQRSVPGHGPAIDAVPDGGASADPDYAALRKFGRERGSLDGTFITPHTSQDDDNANLNRLIYLHERAKDDLNNQLQKASPEERRLVNHELDKVQKRVEDLRSRGVQVGPGDNRLMEAEALDGLWKDGKLNEDVGRTAARLREMDDMENRAYANYSLKHGERAPGDYQKLDARKWLDESPFNPDRKLPQRPQVDSPPARIGPAISEWIHTAFNG